MKDRVHSMVDMFRRYIPWLFLNQLFGSFALYGSQPVLAVIAIRLTGSVFAGGVVIALNFVPAIIVAPLVSTIADKIPRRTLLVLADAVRVVMVSFLIWDGAVGALYAATLVLAACNCVTIVARGALLPSLVPSDKLAAGNALLTLAGSVGRIAGPALMGGALELFGLEASYIMLAACFAAAAILALGVRSVKPRAEHRETRLDYAWGGFRYGFTHPVIRIVLISSALYFFAGGAINVFQVTLSERILGHGAVGYGLIMSLWALGLTLGSLGATNAAAGGTLRGYTLGTILAGVAMGAMGVLPQLWYILVLAGIGGFAETFRVVAASSLKQDLTPDHLRGRVFGAFTALAALAAATGAVVGPRVAAFVDVTVGFFIMGFVSALGGIIAAVMASRGLQAPRAKQRGVVGTAGR